MVKYSTLFLSVAFFMSIANGFGQVTNSSNPCYRLNGAEMSGTFFSKSIPIEEDIYDRNKDGHTQYFQTNCGRRKWDHTFYPTKIRKGIDETVPLTNESRYRTILMDEFEELDTNLWKPVEDDNCPWNRLNSPGSTSNHKFENVKVEEGMLHLQVHRLTENDVYEFTCNGIDYVEQRTHASSKIITTNSVEPNGGYQPGCFRQGKFLTRLKLPSLKGSSKGVNAAFWFWPGEFDVFEIYQPDYDELQTNFHQWKYGNDRPTYSLDFRIDFEAFHTFTFEWTPYKFVYLMDGETMFVLYRFYEILEVETCEDNEFCSIYSEPTIRGLDGDDIPDAMDEEDYFEVWEHGAWQGLSSGNFYTDLVLGAGLANGYNPIFGEMLVDWIKIEQQINGLDLPLKYYMCDEQPKQFNLENPFPSWEDIEWSVSDNLIIIAESKNGIEVQPTSNAKGNAWIDLAFFNWKSNRCFDTKVRQEIQILLDEPIPNPTALDLVFQPANCYFQIKASMPVELVDTFHWTIIKSDGDSLSFKTTKPITPFFTKDELTHQFSVEISASNPCKSSISYSQDFSAPALLGICNRELIVYPNPAKNTVNFKIIEKDGTTLQLLNGKVDIYNKFGILILSQDFTENEEYLDISRLATGIYHVFYTIETNELTNGEILQTNFYKGKNF